MTEPALTEPALRFFGLFALLDTMELPLTQRVPVYSGYFASLYAGLSQEYDWDLPLLHELAGSARTALELGCGNGRVTLALARHGVKVTAVDRSPDMLTLLRRQLAAEDPQVAERVRIVAADMRELALGERFDLVVLPANNISLLAEERDRRTVMSIVNAHLQPTGRFVFDNAVPDRRRLLEQNNDLTACPAESSQGRHIVLMAHRYMPDEGVQLMNLYAERVDEKGVTHRFLGAWTKAVLEEEDLLDLLDDAGLEVTGSEVHDLPNDRRQMKLYVCRTIRQEGAC